MQGQEVLPGQELLPPENLQTTWPYTVVVARSYRAAAGNVGWELLLHPSLPENPPDGCWTGVRVFREGYGVTLYPDGQWDVYDWPYAGGIAAFNNYAHIVAFDSNRSGVGRAIIAVMPGGVLCLYTYRDRGPERVIRYMGNKKWEMVVGLEAARALGWL